jgi:hypothetical protein
MTEEQRAKVKEEEALGLVLRLGQQMSNVCFNLGQGRKLDLDLEVLSAMARNWDLARIDLDDARKAVR